MQTGTVEPSHKLPSRRWQLPAIWLLLSCLALASVYLTKPIAYWHGEIVPVGNDAMYHARRIADTVAHPDRFYEFDDKIHAPEGSLLTWPWGYDFSMAQIARAGVAIGLSSDPIEIAAWVPPAAVVISITLLLLVCAELELTLWVRVLAGLCMALAPTTQILHGVGQLDHHFAEFIFILASLAFGLRWLRQPESAPRAIVLGATLGIAPVIHNGLFVLQVPILVVLGSFWMAKRPPSPVAARFLAASLMVTSLAILIPSQPFRMGRFEYYTLSWFHGYIALCSAATCIFLTHVPFRRSTLLAGFAAAVVLLIPLLTQISHGGEFLVGNLGILKAIAEMQPPLKIALTPDRIALNRLYSLLIWGAPLAWALSLVSCWRERTNTLLLFWLTSLFGLTLLFLQLRLHYFGGFALYLPWLFVIDRWAKRAGQHGKKILLATTLALILLYAPPLRYQIAAPAPIGNEMTFVPLRPMFDALKKECAKDPGIVLADNNLGHFLRYYSDCSVIANNFLLTQQHAEKIEQLRKYLSMSAEELAAEAPFVKYVIVRPAEVGAKDGQLRYRFFFGGNSRLANDLLFDAPERVPANYELLYEVRFEEAGNAPYAKLYRIKHPTPSADAATERHFLSGGDTP